MQPDHWGSGNFSKGAGDVWDDVSKTQFWGDLTNSTRYKEAEAALKANPSIKRVVGHSLGGSVVKKTNTTAKTITEGLASKPVASTAPKKELIVENSNVMALRFQKLAGIKK